MIALPTGTQIWIAAGVTDLRRGFSGLSAQVQTVLKESPFSGHVFVFRGRRGDLIKMLWWDSCEAPDYVELDQWQRYSKGS
jgi:transposase